MTGTIFAKGFTSEMGAKEVLDGWIKWFRRMENEEAVKTMEKAEIVELDEPNLSYPSAEDKASLSYFYRNTPSRDQVKNFAISISEEVFCWSE